jgi:phosphohistidine phosphatase SixA
MAVYLVQHGKSLPKEKDPAKGLSDTGRQETLKIADVAKMYQVPVSRIGHSGKARAEQTAQIFREVLKSGQAGPGNGRGERGHERGCQNQGNVRHGFLSR